MFNTFTFLLHEGLNVINISKSNICIYFFQIENMGQKPFLSHKCREKD